jgi:hypothetical protein
MALRADHGPVQGEGWEAVTAAPDGCTVLFGVADL